MDKATVALILSGLSLVVSSTLGILGYRIQRALRLEELQSRRRADLSVRLDPPGRPKYLVLSASGGTSARDVAIELQPTTVLYVGEPTSFTSLEPGQEEHVLIAISHDDFPPGVPRVIRVRLSWHDDQGPQTKDMSLTV
jgi:hypothetical protein